MISTYRLVGSGENNDFVVAAELVQEVSGVRSDLIYNFRDKLVHLSLSGVSACLALKFNSNLLRALSLLRLVVVN
jgi:hypothetical protein